MHCSLFLHKHGKPPHWVMDTVGWWDLTFVPWCNCMLETLFGPPCILVSACDVPHLEQRPIQVLWSSSIFFPQFIHCSCLFCTGTQMYSDGVVDMEARGSVQFGSPSVLGCINLRVLSESGWHHCPGGTSHGRQEVEREIHKRWAEYVVWKWWNPCSIELIIKCMMSIGHCTIQLLCCELVRRYVSISRY